MYYCKLNNGTGCISNHHVILHFISKVVIIHDLYLKHHCLNYTKQTTSLKSFILRKATLGSKGVDMYYVTCLIDVHEAFCYLVNTITDRGARGGAVVEALRCKPEGRGFDWNF